MSVCDVDARGSRSRRVLGVLAGVAVLASAPSAALAAGADPEPPAPSQGSHLRLDASPGDLLLSPGQSVEWQVGVDLDDPPSPAELGLDIGVSGPLTTVPGGLTVAMTWCPSPSPDDGCPGGTTVVPATPADQLPDAPLEIDGTGGGRLVVTASLAADAPRAAQQQEARVGVLARARGAGPTPTPGAPPTDSPSDPAAPPTDTPPSDTPPAGPPAPGATPPTDRFADTGAPLLGPALLAVSSVLVGTGLAAARRRHLRHPHEEGSPA